MFAGGSVCENPTVDATAYTTLDATLLTKIAYISDFSLTCSNGAKVGLDSVSVPTQSLAS